MNIKLLILASSTLLLLVGGCNDVETKPSPSEHTPKSENLAKNPELTQTQKTVESLVEAETPSPNVSREIEGVERPDFTITANENLCEETSIPENYDTATMERVMTLGDYTLYSQTGTLICDDPFLLKGSCAVTNNVPFRVKTNNKDVLITKRKSGSISFTFDETRMGCILVQRN